MELPGSRENYFLGGILGVATFCAIFLIGLLSGVSLGLLLLRGILFGLLVTGLGTGAGFLLERLVPGLWDDGAGLSGMGPAMDTGEGGGIDRDDQSQPSFEYTVSDDVGTSEPLPDGTEDIGNQMPAEPRASRMVTGESKVVGNFRIIDDKQFPNDPEDYAKAIRTMMSRDKE